MSLAGTLNNCAGGKTPWETWLTCEESETAPSAPVQHGYVFEVDPYDQNANRDPKPIKAFGRGASHLVGSTDSGVVFFLARNELNDSEFAGPCFSGDRKTLFANIQSPGYVLAVQGPWRKQR